MDIKVLGSGCAKCKATTDIITRVAAETGRDITLEKIEDMRQIASFGVMTTPAVIVEGKVVHKGSVPSHDEVLAFLG
ncbi:thioredoxin family protein [Solirhodobacter olei]|uniref:thioredoxin family protein n=1 Tax=Solirhodobacter olei TaxID=2493082 RepID=UPI000FD93571|nr:thioredoxin family protein [Solirhodobacter olei]